MERVVDPKSGSGALAACRASSRRAAPRQWTRPLWSSPRQAVADFPYLVCQSSYNTCILKRDYAGDFVKNPIGTGPFMLESYNAKQKAVMKKNPTYWGKDASGTRCRTSTP